VRLSVFCRTPTCETDTYTESDVSKTTFARAAEKNPRTTTLDTDRQFSPYQQRPSPAGRASTSVSLPRPSTSDNRSYAGLPRTTRAERRQVVNIGISVAARRDPRNTEVLLSYVSRETHDSSQAKNKPKKVAQETETCAMSRAGRGRRE